jgi:hypothetical protein
MGLALGAGDAEVDVDVDVEVEYSEACGGLERIIEVPKASITRRLDKWWTVGNRTAQRQRSEELWSVYKTVPKESVTHGGIAIRAR